METPVRLKNFPQLFPETGLTVAALRWQIFNSAHNGLKASGAIARVGRSVFIVPDAYFGWMRSNPSVSIRASGR